MGVWPGPRIELLITPVSKTAASVDVKKSGLKSIGQKKSAQPPAEVNSAQLRSTMTLQGPTKANKGVAEAPSTKRGAGGFRRSRS